MTRRFIHALLALAMLLPGLVFLTNTGNLADYFERPTPAGQFAYVLSRLFALYALTLIWLQILLGALRPDLERGLGYRRLVRLHTTLGMVTLGLLVGHVALFQLGVTIRAGHFPTPNLVPDFFAPYYASQIAFGATALYLALVGALAAALRQKHWMQGIWRKVHMVNYAVFGFAAWHALAIGSETRLQPLHALFAFFMGTIALAALWRISRARFVADGTRSPAR